MIFNGKITNEGEVRGEGQGVRSKGQGETTVGTEVARERLLHRSTLSLAKPPKGPKTRERGSSTVQRYR